MSKRETVRAPMKDPPKELVDLEFALDALREAGEPGYGPQALDGYARISDEWRGGPDEARSGWRRAYDAARKDVGRLAVKLQKRLGMETDDKPRRRCRSCRRFLRDKAAFCDSCGVQQEEPR